MIEGDGVTLLNANDAKIAGWPLRHLVARHGPIDFAFRSHSSANARVCWRLEGDTGLRRRRPRALHALVRAVHGRGAAAPCGAVRLEPLPSARRRVRLQRHDRHAARAARARARLAAAALDPAGDAAGLALAGRGRAAGPLRSGARDAVRRHAGDASRLPCRAGAGARAIPPAGERRRRRRRAARALPRLFPRVGLPAAGAAGRVEAGAALARRSPPGAR